MPPEYKNEINLKAFDKKRIMCIEYPGIVQNVNKMISTLGGLENLGIAYGTRNRRIELRFRPDDIYSKPACAERHPTTSIVLKVRMKYKSRDIDTPCSSQNTEEPQSVTYVASLIGVVDTIFKFNNLCDFQYLPMYSTKDGTCVNIHDKLFPSTLPDTSWLMQENVPLFLSPPLFSRFDTVHYYDAQRSKDNDENSHLIGRTRRRRTGYTMFANFKDEKVPQQPSPESLKILKTRSLNQTHYDALHKLFEDRPVWSKNALIYHTKLNKDQMKMLLPLVAYHFSTGPWRVMWVKYGYDPRKNPRSVVYQTLDYRLRTTGGLKNIVKAKRSYSNYLLPYKSSPSSRPKVVVIDKHSMSRAESAYDYSKMSSLHENTFIFRPGMIPPSRQMFYQYCDVHVPEIQAMLTRLQAKREEAECNSRTGWLPESFDSRCREIVSSLVSAELRKQMTLEQRERAGQEPVSLEPEQPEGLPPHEIEITDSDSDTELNDSVADTDEFVDSDLDEGLGS